MITTVNFIGTAFGQWCVESMCAIAGHGLPNTSHVRIASNEHQEPSDSAWRLTGFTSNVRYTEKAERERLSAVQADLGRLNATCAALIPIRKNAAWWTLAQDERRNIFEAQSHHIEIGLRYLPPIARKLYHCRDIGQEFDFLTWFEFAPEHSNDFDHLLDSLRRTEEWKYVEREVEIRLTREIAYRIE